MKRSGKSKNKNQKTKEGEKTLKHSIIFLIVAPHDAAGLTLKPMKIMLSISPFYCRGLIYQARAGRFTRGFDESNPYDRIDVHFFFAPLRVSSRLIFIAGIIAFGSNLCGWYMHDYSCIAFPDQCDENGMKESNPILGQLIPEAAVSFLESTRDFEDFLKEVEKSELYGPNYTVLKSCIEKAITGMENARCKYGEIVNISESLEMNIAILEKLLHFDYDGLQSKYHLNPSIFEKASAICQRGDIIGIYNHTFDTIETILENLYRIKATLEKESLPELYIIWETGQLYSESEMFGQYVSRIFYEINREVKGEI